MSEDSIKIFDLRNMKRPWVVIQREQRDRLFGGFEWAHYRQNLLVSFFKR